MNIINSNINKFSLNKKYNIEDNIIINQKINACEIRKKNI